MHGFFSTALRNFFGRGSNAMYRNSEAMLPLSRVFELAVKNQRQHRRSPLFISLAIIEIGLTTGLLLFLFGAIAYGRATREILHYKNSLCQVDSSKISESRCETKFGPPTCYIAVWIVRYGDSHSISSQIQKTGFFQRDKALKMQNAYKV